MFFLQTEELIQREPPNCGCWAMWRIPVKPLWGCGERENRGRIIGGQLKRKWGKGLQQSCSTLHTPVSTGSWMRLSWACKSSRLDISYSGSVSVQPDRRGRHSQEKRWERWKTTAVDKRAQLKEPVITVQPVPCNRAFGGSCCHSILKPVETSGWQTFEMERHSRWFYHMGGRRGWGRGPPLEGGDGDDLDVKLIMICAIQDIC